MLPVVETFPGDLCLILFDLSFGEFNSTFLLVFMLFYLTKHKIIDSRNWFFKKQTKNSALRRAEQLLSNRYILENYNLFLTFLLLKFGFQHFYQAKEQRRPKFYY